MSTVPNTTPTEQTPAERKARAAGYVEGVRDRLAERTPVKKAIEALKAFECSTFDEARTLLRMYAGRRDMTIADVREVLAHFTEMETVDALLKVTPEQAARLDEAERPCPEWCEVNHLDPEVLAHETDPVIRARGHSCTVLIGDRDEMSVKLYQLEKLDDDETFPVDVVVDADGLSPDAADRLAAALVEAARIARG